MQVAAGCVIRDRQGRVLLVKPTYKPRWEIPGGAVEEGESPLEACKREVFEELGIEVVPSRLLSVDHQPVHGGRRGALRFVFDGGVVHDEQLAAICMQPSELSAWKMAGLAELDELLRPTVATRVRVGIEQPGTYLEEGAPVAHSSDSAPGRSDDR